MKGGRRRIFSGTPVGARKDRDEDLLLFHEMQRREKEQILNLLQPVSDEFELNSGNHALYGIPSAKKGAEADHKNDYDWLKTPPATPLFPSLEMEANDPNLISQKQIPILQPMKYPQFSGIREPPTPNRDAKSSSSSRSVTPKRKPHVSVSKPSSMKTVPAPRPGLNLDRKPMFSSLPAKPTNPKEISSNSADTNRSKSRASVSHPKPRSRGVSPSPTPIIPAAIHGFSPETPADMRTQVSDRPSSVWRGRPGYSIPKTDTKQDIGKQRRQSWSTSATRGRNAEIIKESDSKGKNLSINGSMVIGSRMVEKMMNARKSDGGEAKDPKHKYLVSANDKSGNGRTVSKDSLNLALKRMV